MGDRVIGRGPSKGERAGDPRPRRAVSVQLIRRPLARLAMHCPGPMTRAPNADARVPTYTPAGYLYATGPADQLAVDATWNADSSPL